MTLEEAINIVNQHNRADGKPLVHEVSCDFCNRSFARMVTDANLTEQQNRRTICLRKECKNAAARASRAARRARA